MNYEYLDYDDFLELDTNILLKPNTKYIYSPKYVYGKVYAIHPISNKDMMYIGSTTLPLKTRFQKHYQRWKDGKINSSINILFDYWNIEDLECIILEYYPCNSREELLFKERQYIKKLKPINTRIPLLFQYERQKKVCDYYKSYYKRNKNKIIKQVLKRYYEKKNKDI